MRRWTSRRAFSRHITPPSNARVAMCNAMEQLEKRGSRAHPPSARQVKGSRLPTKDVIEPCGLKTFQPESEGNGF